MRMQISLDGLQLVEIQLLAGMYGLQTAFLPVQESCNKKLLLVLSMTVWEYNESEALINRLILIVEFKIPVCFYLIEL